MVTQRIKKYLLEKLKEEYQDEPFQTCIDTILMEIAIAKKYKPDFVRSQDKMIDLVGEDTNIRLQEDLLKELRKEFPDKTVSEIVQILLTDKETEFRGIYPEQMEAMKRDFPRKSIYEVGMILRAQAK